MFSPRRVSSWWLSRGGQLNHRRTTSETAYMSRGICIDGGKTCAWGQQRGGAGGQTIGHRNGGTIWTHTTPLPA